MASTLRLVFEEYHAGNLPYAEALARQWLRAAPDSESARPLLDKIRREYGISDGFALSEKAVRQEQTLRYLVIKAWGEEFWSEGHHVVTQLLRSLVVLCGNHVDNTHC
jgi:hypothetical protein